MQEKLENWITTFVKFIYSEEATKSCEMSTNYLSYVLPVKWLVEILQNFVAFSEYMNFMEMFLTANFAALHRGWKGPFNTSSKNIFQKGFL